jgi:large subunit ribosomal protein L28
MSKVCQITGKKLMFGNRVSHSKRRTRRQFHPNLFTKRFFIPEDNKWITLNVSGAGLRIINRLGITEAIKQARQKGVYQ